MKNILLTIFIVLFFANTVHGTCVLTGGACAIDDLRPTTKKQNKKEIKIKNKETKSVLKPNFSKQKQNNQSNQNK